MSPDEHGQKKFIIRLLWALAIVSLLFSLICYARISLFFAIFWLVFTVALVFYIFWFQSRMLPHRFKDRAYAKEFEPILNRWRINNDSRSFYQTLTGMQHKPTTANYLFFYHLNLAIACQGMHNIGKAKKYMSLGRQDIENFTGSAKYKAFMESIADNQDEELLGTED